MVYLVMKRHGGILNAYYLVKEANLKRLHTVWSQLYYILEKAKLHGDSKNISGCQGLGVEGMNNQSTEDFFGQWNYSVRYYNDGYMSL